MRTRNAELFDCYISGQISERQWYEHLREEPGLRSYVLERVPNESVHTLGVRERAFNDWAATSALVDDTGSFAAKEIFKAGWQARTLYDLKTGWRDKL